MEIYTLGDLHLSVAVDKPMDVFGGRWNNHQEKIKENWINVVSDDDIVVVPGDVSWAMTLEEVVPDLLFIESLPGRKILLKGNHEYWWVTKRKLKELKEEYQLSSIEFLHNDSIYIEEMNVSICGTRGWKCPDGWDAAGFSAQDSKVYAREIQRLEMSLKSGLEHTDKVVCFIHFPPFNNKGEPSGFTELMEKYRVNHCYYGHLHGPSQKDAKNGKLNESCHTEYHLVAGDYLDFTPEKVQI